jgi:DNA-directed RNA polymerase II subunit RPB2
MVGSAAGDAFEEAEFNNQEDQEEIQQEDAWAVIHSFFDEKGLVRQQLDSFDEFVSNTIQEIVDETPEIVVKPENQHAPGADQAVESSVEYRIKFGQIFLSKPLNTEVDGETVNLFPREARLRNLT